MHCVSDEIAQYSSAVTSIPGIPRTRDTERSMINATTRERRFETRLETRFDCGY